MLARGHISMQGMLAPEHVFSMYDMQFSRLMTGSGVMIIFAYQSKIPPSEFFPISEDWCKLGIPNLAQMSLIKCYWMLQNAWVTAFTDSELLTENQQGAGG